jgi:predicted PhzF superfamily epimerase YddE/YHI9
MRYDYIHLDVFADRGEALGVGEDEIRNSGLPVQEISSGVPFLFVPMATRSSVDRASVVRTGLCEFYEANGLPELPVFVFSVAPAK